MAVVATRAEHVRVILVAIHRHRHCGLVGDARFPHGALHHLRLRPEPKLSFTIGFQRCLNVEPPIRYHVENPIDAVHPFAWARTALDAQRIGIERRVRPRRARHAFVRSLTFALSLPLSALAAKTLLLVESRRIHHHAPTLLLPELPRPIGGTSQLQRSGVFNVPRFCNVVQRGGLGEPQHCPRTEVRVARPRLRTLNKLTDRIVRQADAPGDWTRILRRRFRGRFGQRRRGGRCPRLQYRCG